MAVWRTQHVVRLILRQSRSPALGFAFGMLSWAGVPLDAGAAELPVPCVAGSCGPNVSAWVTSGSATANVSGNTLNVVQNSDRAILNWSSFNVDADGRVVFTQPSSSSIALNRIFQQSPSRIFGAVEANGQLYLINPNGMIFGATAKVSTAGLLASTLKMDESVFQNGILSPKLLQQGKAALESNGHVYVQDADGHPVIGPDGEPLEIRISVENGASIKTTGSGGRVLLASRTVENSGNITTPDGQIILAAGEKVYLQASTDPSLRGLLVEVDSGGTAANQLKGVLTADHGNVTLVGLAVNQSGRISANTSVAANGSVRLLARDKADQALMETGKLVATHGGTLELGSTSTIELLPDASDTATAVTAQEQLLPSASLSGKEIYVRGGSSLTATGGTVTINAALDPSVIPVANAGAKVRVESGAKISVAGSSATVPVERNLVSVELRANELANSPLQRNGVLRGKAIVVDARVGTPLADVSGAIDAIPAGIDERLSKGGTIDVQSAGDVFVDSRATFDVSGGAVKYTGGLMQTTQLITNDGDVVDIGSADPSRTYIGLVNPTYRVKHDKWGVIDVFQGPGIARNEPGYTDGSSAGKLSFAAPAMVLSGDFIGRATIGELQRQQNKLPAAGTLVIGIPTGVVSDAPIPDFRAPAIRLVNEAAPISVGDDGSLANLSELELPIDFLTHGGFKRADLYSNTSITLPAGVPLDLLGGTVLNLRAQRIDVQSSITAPGGSLTMTQVDTVGHVPLATTPGIAIAPQVTLDVSGTWTNDTLLPPSLRPVDPVFVNAGSIQISTKTNEDSEVIIGAGTQFLANGGGWLKSNNTLTGGAGGQITIAASDNASESASALELGEGIGLQAFGVAGAKGGSFSLQAARFSISDQVDWQHEQRVSQESGDAIELGTSLFSDFGLSSITLTAYGTLVEDSDLTTTLNVAPGTRLDATSRTLQFADSYRMQASGANLLSVTTPTLLPENQQIANSVSLVAPDRNGAITLGRDAVLTGAAGSSFSLSSGGRVFIDGQIRTHAGNIAVKIAAAPDAPYQPDLQLEIGAHAQLDVSGTALFPQGNFVGPVGQILGGGSINLTAGRGSVVVQPGALLDFSGTQATLSLPDAQRTGTFKPQVVAGDAGSLVIRAPESIAVLGTLHGAAGRGETGAAKGGSLNVALSRMPINASVVGSFPSNPRVVLLTSDDAKSLVPAPSGTAILSDSYISRSGIDALTVESDGRIDIDPGFDLRLARSLTFETPVISMTGGGTASLHAPSVTLQNTKIADPNVLATGGAGLLNVSGDFIELIGATALQGIDSALLSSSTDLRLRSTDFFNNSRGAFRAGGDLTLAASRIYGSTRSTFTVSAGADRGTLRIEQTGASSGTPLSADSHLTFSAYDIVQNGTLLAPFGTIDLNAAHHLTLGAGSLTSASTDGALIPFGTIQVGDWIYQSSANKIATTPVRAVNLSGESVELAAGSRVDVSGGGDLYAYEWIPGTGGKKDALAPGTTPGLYAVLPSMRDQFASPYDPQEFEHSDLAMGESVYLSGGAGLEAGYYPLLPARYALLPGAVLVSAASGFEDLAPGTTGKLVDGAKVVVGYRTYGTTGLGGTRYSGFAVRPGSYGRLIAEYRDTFASNFFKLPADSDAIQPPLPADAGRLSISVGQTLSALGKVSLAGAGSSGLSGDLELSATNLLVTGNSNTEVPEDVTAIASSQLMDWRPGRLLLGGRRTNGDKQINVTADTVEIGADASLSLDEVVMVGRTSVSLDANSSVRSLSADTGKAPSADLLPTQDITLGGAPDAALLAVSDRSVLRTTRNAPGADVGRITLEEGSLLASGGALVVDAAGGATLNGDLSGAHAQWLLGAGHIAFSEDPAVAPDGIVINQALTSRLNGARSMEFVSNAPIELHESVTLGGLGLESLVFSAGLSNLAQAGSASFTADSITLFGSGAALTPTTGGTSQLALNTSELLLRPGVGLGDQTGHFLLDGFASTNIVAAREVRTTGKVALDASGDVRIETSRMAADSASTAHFTAAEGTLTVAGSSAPLSTPLAAAPLGGALALQAKNVALEGGASVVAPSGIVSLEATDDITIANGATLDASGRTVALGSATAGSFGGRITVAAGGALSIDSGAHLKVDGGAGADAGLVDLSAGGLASLGGNVVSGLATGGGRGGAFSLEAGSLGDFGSLVSTVGAGGFSKQVDVHVHAGDLALAAGTQLASSDVSLVTDAGQITVAGTISASNGISRPSIRLFGADGVTLDATGALLADNAAANRRGGYVGLGASTGQINLTAGSRISAQGAAGGELWLRAAATADDVQIGSLGASLTGIDGINIEAVRTSSLAFDPGDFELGTIRDDAVAYSALAKPNIESRLGAAAGAPLRLRVGVELTHDGDLTLPDIDLTTWRTADSQPIVLTARTTGNLTVAGTISDGFRTLGSFLNQRIDLMVPDQTSPTPNASASIRLVAGADLASVDPLAVHRGAEADLVLSDNAVVRTGTGSIDLVAARDVSFMANASVYTAGSSGSPTIGGTSGPSMALPTNGGALSVRAGRDVLGQSSAQGITEWMRRQGTPDGATGLQQVTAWGVDLREFHWDLGTLGGGDLDITAGRDVLNLSAASANSAIEAQPNVLTEFRGGDLNVTAGGDAGGNLLYVANGTAVVSAGGGLTQSRTGQNGAALGTMFATGDASIFVKTRLDAQIAGVVSPTTLQMPSVNASRQPYFFNYGAANALHAFSAAGDVRLVENIDQLTGFFGSVVTSSPQAAALYVLPPSLDLVSFSRDIAVSNDSGDGFITLYPSDTSQLRLLAARDVTALPGASGSLAMSDAPASSLSQAVNPFIGGTSITAMLAQTSARHSSDAAPVVIAAGRDINGVGLTLPKQARVTAGRDIVNTSLVGQNLLENDLTLLSAGRDLIVTNPGLRASIEVGGPGRLDVLAGRNVDLGFSLGISTTGRLKNPLLPQGGADITVMTGLTDHANYQALVNLVAPGSQKYRDELVAYVEKVSGQTGLRYEDAKAIFDAYDDSLKRPLADSLFMQVLVQTGRDYNKDPTLGYDRGYAAIDTLFPGSRAENATSYAGDLKMPLSRIYTIDGGDITLLVPGGLIDVGLANPPASLDHRDASELGIVAQREGSVKVYSKGSVLVNASRVFTLLGGDIGIWSTLGDIDAGRGSKSAISAPPPVVLVDNTGKITLDFSSAVQGSGIRTILTAPGVHPGDVDLIAPVGTVNAGDAGIGAAGNLNVAAQQVAGLDNIQVGGTATGVPPETSGLGVSLSGASSTASSASSASGTSISDGSGAKTAPMAESALGWLDVFVEGFGEEVCKASDVACLKRQKLASP